MAEALLDLQNLDVHYGAIHALRGVSFRVGQGEIVTLIGANGAGKTTTLRAVSGMLRPSGGQIQYEESRSPASSRTGLSLAGSATLRRAAAFFPT